MRLVASWSHNRRAVAAHLYARVLYVWAEVSKLGETVSQPKRRPVLQMVPAPGAAPPSAEDLGSIETYEPSIHCRGDIRPYSIRFLHSFEVLKRTFASSPGGP